MALPSAVSFYWLLNFDIFHHLGLKRLLILEKGQVQVFFSMSLCHAGPTWLSKRVLRKFSKAKHWLTTYRLFRLSK